MHPLLTRNRLGLYLLGWIPLAAILVLLMASGGSLSWLESSVIVIPLCVVYAFICLSAWYTAKSAPIQRESALRLIAVHSVAAALVSYFWMGLGWVLVASLSKTSAFQGLERRHPLRRRIPALFALGGIAVRDSLVGGLAGSGSSRDGNEYSCSTSRAEGS